MASSGPANVPDLSPNLTGRLIAALQVASELLSECTDSRVEEADELLHRIHENLHGEMIKEDAAAALLKVKEAQVEEGHPEYRSRRNMHTACKDVLVVCCCRECNLSDVPTLKLLFNNAFQNNMPANVMADLLNSRHQVSRGSMRITRRRRGRAIDQRETSPSKSTSTCSNAVTSLRRSLRRIRHGKLRLW